MFALAMNPQMLSMHINRKPGELMEVDWAGQTTQITDADTGETIEAYLFVSVLPYSGYAYAEAFLSMEQRHIWISMATAGNTLRLCMKV